MAEICRLVGGHALAVELAASWTRLMPCAAIATQIRQDLDFLAGGPRNAPDRHRSLRALFDHSWALLSPTEQRALAKLSVFRSGFAPEQAAGVAGASWPLLLGLVDKSQYRDVTDSLLRVGLVAAALGEHRRAVMILNCAEALAADSGNREVLPLQAKVAAALARLQENLPAAEFHDAAAHGRQMSLEALFATV